MGVCVLKDESEKPQRSQRSLRKWRWKMIDGMNELKKKTPKSNDAKQVRKKKKDETKLKASLSKCK